MALTQSPRKIEAALGDLVNGNIWPDTKPKESPAKEYIVYTLVDNSPADFGDDQDQVWTEMYMIQYTHAGRTNYLNMKDEMRSRLREAGFSFYPANAGYDDAAKATYVDIVCGCIEGE